MQSETKKMEQKGQKMKGGRSTKKNDKGDDEERKESEECLLQHPWCGNVSPQFTCTETYTRTFGLSCSVEGCGTHNGWWPMGYDD